MRRTAKLGVCALALASVAVGQGQFHAKIVLEDGTPLPTTPQITPALSGWLVPNCRILNVFGNGNVEYAVNWRSRPYDGATADVCEVRIRLAGYRQADVTLRNGAVIVLKRLGDHEGSTVSMTTLKAPEEARKAYEQGAAAMSQKKWARAQAGFERAVAIYPDYAPAWSELGEVFREQSKPKEARAAWERALEADPKYVRPYLQLTRLALAEGRTQDAVGIAERALELNPVEFPGIYFYYAVANYNLGRLDVAEKSARRAIELDADREIPRAEDLLGSVLAAKGDQRGAIEHLRRYLAISPQATDAAEVRQRIAELERRATEAK
ncbi:MAG: tetratricopeptide repeat protein [Bryobacteraceae bacterium]